MWGGTWPRWTKIQKWLALYVLFLTSKIYCLKRIKRLAWRTLYVGQIDVLINFVQYSISVHQYYWIDVRICSNEFHVGAKRMVHEIAFLSLSGPSSVWGTVSFCWIPYTVYLSAEIWVFSIPLFEISSIKYTYIYQNTKNRLVQAYKRFKNKEDLKSESKRQNRFVSTVLFIYEARITQRA